MPDATITPLFAAFIATPYFSVFSHFHTLLFDVSFISSIFDCTCHCRQPPPAPLMPP